MGRWYQGLLDAVPSVPEEVPERMWGDCKDKSLLLVELLAEAPMATPIGPDLDANGEVAHRTRRRGVSLLAAPPVMLWTSIDASGEVAQLAVRFLEELDDPLQQTGEERCPTIQGHGRVAPTRVLFDILTGRS